MSKETGGPAFPVPDSQYQFPDTGMSLRDWMAGKAMQGDMSFDPLSPGVTNEQLEKYANHYYRIADAMLTARNQ